MSLYSSQAQPSQTLALYGDCVASLRTSLAYLESANTTLGASPRQEESLPLATSGAVADMPRFGNVVKTVRHYELVPQPTLAAAEASLQNEIGPAVASLLDRASHQLARQARRIDTLQARAALLAGRLEEPTTERQPAGRAAPTTSRPRTTASTDLRARMIHQRKEQLKYSVARLEREVAQKERELRQRLRQSMAG
ncbi:DASH complex subunit spc19 [Sporothrix bragantina]|uniref:DASH complex subunit SPC19 n=1 Tax=Sporothrix bragantina TaxID=671064 RepID=A0ABP0B6Y3_9PEZI